MDIAVNPQAPAPAGPRQARPLSPLGPTVVALFLVALTLRPQIVGIGPLLPIIRADLAISHAVGGLVAAIPVLCMGLFALVGPWLGRRLGIERAIAASVAAIVLFGLARAFAPEPLSLVLLTFGIGIGVGVVGPLLPLVVHLRAAQRAIVATGIYAGGISAGATLGAGLAVPLAGAELNWRLPLVAFSLASLGGLVAWLALERPRRPSALEREARAPRLPWLSGRAWKLALLFGTQSILFYAANSWLPTIYVERGWPEAHAGLLVAATNGISLLTTLGASALNERIGSRRGGLALWTTTALVGLGGITVAPELTVLWVVCLGLGLGGIFPLVLTLPVDFARDGAGNAGGLAAIMLFGGYVMASTGPFVLGLLRDATGDFQLSLWLLVVVALAKLVMSWRWVPAGLGRRAT